MTLTADPDTAEAHCYQCRGRKEYRRLLASAPVFACTGCGNSREMHELGRPGFTGMLPEAAQPRTRDGKEKKMAPKSALQNAIDEAVAEAIGEDVVRKADVQKLVKDAVAQELENGLPELVSQALTQMLARPKPESGGGSRSGKAPGHVPHRGRCGKRCRDAAAAESDS